MRTDIRIRHLLDTRRAEGRKMLSEPRADGTGYVAMIIQHPVICVLDLVELDAGAADDVTYRPEAVTCPDCLARLEAGRDA